LKIRESRIFHRRNKLRLHFKLQDSCESQAEACPLGTARIIEHRHLAAFESHGAGPCPAAEVEEPADGSSLPTVVIALCHSTVMVSRCRSFQPTHSSTHDSRQSAIITADSVRYRRSQDDPSLPTRSFTDSLRTTPKMDENEVVSRIVAIRAQKAA
jgi:hypothetical protein